MSRYNYYDKNKKPKLFSWATYFKIVSIVLVGLIGVFGLTVLILYWTGAFEQKLVPPDGIKITLNEDDDKATTKINNISYYIPEVTTDESGSATFSLTVADALKSVDEEELDNTKSKATMKDLSVDVSDERVIKVKSEECILGQPIVFEVVKVQDKNGNYYIQGGFATITIRSGDGVYGQVSQNIFIDAPVLEIANDYHIDNTATGEIYIAEEEEVEGGFMLVGDEFTVKKPTYTPEWSSNPTYLGDNKYGKADKLYTYTIESLSLQANGEYRWDAELLYEYVEKDKQYKWVKLGTGTFFKLENNRISTTKKGVFRVSCSTCATYDDEEIEDAVRIYSQYSYFEVQEVSFTNLTSTISSYQFEYSMQGVSREADLKEYRVYLNTARTGSNIINLGMMPTVPNGYNVSDSRKKMALKDVYLTSNTSINTYYIITGDTTRSSSQEIYPIQEYYDVSAYDYYYSVKLKQLNTASMDLTFKLSTSTTNGEVKTVTVSFSMAEISSTIQVQNISEDTTGLYGKYLSMSIADATINNERVKSMNVLVDSNLGVDELYGVDLKKIFSNVGENNKTPSYWLMRYYIKLTISGGMDNYSTIVGEMANNTIGEIVELDSNVTGAEIIDGYFAPQAYARYEIYAVLIKTDYNGNPVIDSVSGTIKYRSAKLFVNVEIKLSSVILTMCDSDGETIEDDILKEGSSYYLRIEPNVIGEAIGGDLLENYIDKLVISPIVAYTTDINKIIPINIGEIRLLNSGSLDGYYALITITATQSDTKQTDDYVHELFFQVIYDGEEQFGVTSQFTIQDTSVRGLNLVINNATISDNLNITFSASWNPDMHTVVWQCDSAYGTVMQNERTGTYSKYSFRVSVIGENTTTKFNLTGSSVSISRDNNNYSLYISDVLLETDIQLDIMSVENEKYKKTIYIRLDTPQVNFSLNASSSIVSNNNLVIQNNEIRKQGESAAYNHIVYNNQNNGLGINLREIIVAKLAGSNITVTEMLDFSFANPNLVAQYATLNVDSEGIEDIGVVRFIKNPADPLLVTVQIKAFNYQINFMFLLENNIEISYSNIASFFNDSPKDIDAGSLTQNRIIMSYYNGAYYPTIVYYPADQSIGTYGNRSEITLSSLFNVIYKNNNNAVTNFSYILKNATNWVTLSGSGSGAKLVTYLTSSVGIHAPVEVVIEVAPNASEGGKSVAFTFLLVPNILVESGTIESKTLVLTNNNSIIKDRAEMGITEGYQTGTETSITSGNVYYPGRYSVVTQNKEYSIVYSDIRDSTDETSRNILLTDDRLFSVLDFSGNEFVTGASNMNNVTVGQYVDNLRKAASVQNITFRFNENNADAISIDSIMRLENVNATLVLNVSNILTTLTTNIYMAILFTDNSIVLIPASVTIKPFYELVLNTNNSAVEKAKQIASIEPYIDILDRESAIVFYVGQTMNMNVLLSVKLNYSGTEELTALEKQEQINNANTKYLNLLSYTFSTKNNQIKMQNSTSAKNATVIASSYSATDYSTIQVSYNGIITGYCVYMFVCSNANIWQTNSSSELVLDSNLGLGLRNQTVNGTVYRPTETEADIASYNFVPGTTAIVDYNAVLQLKNTDNNTEDGMFVFKGIDGMNADVSFAIINQAGYNLTILNQNTGILQFEQSAKDVLIVLNITATNMYYLQKVVDGENVSYESKSLSWTYYFKLQATQTIQVTYPFNNDEYVFNAYYEDDIDLTTVGVKGYVRAKVYDVINLGDKEMAHCILRATNNIDNSDIWNQLEFNVQYHNASTGVWQDTSILSLGRSGGEYDRIIQVPGRISKDYEFIRIHVTSARSGVDAYINIRINSDEDDVPTLNYPQSSITFAQDGKQYELRDKSTLQTGDTILLTEYDNSNSTTRININNNAGKVYYDIRAYNISDVELYNINISIQGNSLVIFAPSNYDDALKIKIYMRSDYAYFTQAGDMISYNIYYGNRIEIQPNYDNPRIAIDSVTGDKYIRCQVDNSQGAVNKLYVSTVFNVVALDGSVVSISTDNYSISNEHPLVNGQGSPDLAYSVDGSGEMYISYENVLIPAGGYSIKLTLTIDGTQAKSMEIRIFPSVATISNNNGTLNTVDNPEIVACGKTFNILKSNISFSGLDGLTLKYYLGNDEQLGDSWIVQAPSNVYNLNSLLTEYEISIKYSGITVRKIILYVRIMPEYKLETVVGPNASVNGNGDSYASVPSGTIYNVSSEASAMYFNFFKTTDGLTYTLLSGNDLNNYNLTFEKLDLNGNKLKDLPVVSGYFDYGQVDGKSVHFKMTAEDVLIRVTATVASYATYCANNSITMQEGYARQSFIIKLTKNIDSSRIHFDSNNGQANSITNPITLVASGVSLLSMLDEESAIDLYYKTNLSNFYTTGETFNAYKFIKCLDINSTTFNNSGVPSDVLEVTFNDGTSTITVKKAEAFLSSESTIHSLTIKLFGVEIAVVYFVVPRDFAYTFDSSFVTMQANDVLDLETLANSLVDYKEDVIGEGNIEYTLVSSSASTIAGANVTNYVTMGVDSVTNHQTLSIPSSKQTIEQEITLIASVKNGDEFLTAKAVVHVLPKFTLEATNDVLYLDENPIDVLEARESGVPKQTSSVTQSTLTKNGSLSTISAISIKKYTLDDNSVNIIQIDNTYAHDETTEHHAVMYSPMPVQDNLIAGNDIILDSYLGEFYYVKDENGTKVNIRQVSTDSVKFYKITYSGSAVNATFCENSLLNTSISSTEYKQQVLVEANVNFVDRVPFTVKCYGIIELVIYPTLNLNTFYTHNAQSVSVFKALKAYDLNDYIKVVALGGNNESKEIIKKGELNFANIKLFGKVGNVYQEIDYTTSGDIYNNDYFSLARYITIGERDYLLTKDNATRYKLYDGVNTLYVPVGDYFNSYLRYGNTEYTIQDRLEFTDAAIGCSAMINAKYTNSEIGDTSNMVASYFIKVDVMDLELTQTPNVMLYQNDVLAYTMLVSSANDNPNRASRIIFDNAGSTYYDVANNAGEYSIVNVGNIYKVECLINIHFIYANNKEFIYTAKFILMPHITISYQSYGSGEVTSIQFVGDSTPNLLEYINYTGEGEFALGNSKSLLKEIVITINNENYVYSKDASDGAGYYKGIAEVPNLYTIKANNNLANVFAVTLDSSITEKTFTVMFRFKSNNQTLNLIFTINKVTATTEFSFSVQKVTINAGESLVLENVKATKDGTTLALDSNKFSYYVSDNSLVTASIGAFSNNQVDITLQAVPVVASTTTGNESIRTYLTLVYIDASHQKEGGIDDPIYEKKYVEVDIIALTEDQIKTNGNINGNVSYPQITNNYSSYIYSAGSTYYKVFVNGVEDNSKFGTYFTDNGTTISPKQTYYANVRLYLYKQFTLKDINGGEGQKIILCNTLDINPITPQVYVSNQSLVNGSLLDLKENQTLTFTVGNSAYMGNITSFDYINAGDTGTLNLDITNRQISRANVNNQNVPITITVTSLCGEYYYYNVTLRCVNMDMSLGVVNLYGDEKTVSGSENLSTFRSNNGYTENMWVINYNNNTFNRITNLNNGIPADAKYLICEKQTDSGDVTRCSYYVYRVMHTYNILLGDDVNDTFEVYNSSSFDYNFSLQVDGRTISSGVTFAINDSISPIVKKASNTGITFTASATVVDGTNICFQIAATVNNFVYYKDYSFTFKNGYANGTDIYLTGTYNFNYNNGKVYTPSVTYNLLDLSNFTYTNAHGVEYSYNNGSITSTSSLAYREGNYIVSRIYPTGDWTTDTAGNINGYAYNNETVTLTIPVRADGDSQTRQIKYTFTISRTGVSGITTNYAKNLYPNGVYYKSSGSNYENSTTLYYNNDTQEQSITLNYTFPFQTTYGRFGGVYLGVESYTYYVDFGINNKGRMVEPGSIGDERYLRKAVYSVLDICFYDGHNTSSINATKVENTCTGYYKSGINIDSTYSLDYSGYKIMEDSSFFSFVKVKVNVYDDAYIDEDLDRDYEFIVPIYYERMINSSQQSTIYNGNDDSVVTGAQATPDNGLSKSSSITHYNVISLIRNDTESAVEQIVNKYGVLQSSIQKITTNKRYTFVQGDTRFIINFVNPTVTKRELTSWETGGNVLHGDAVVGALDEYKIKYESIKLFISNNDELEFVHYATESSSSTFTPNPHANNEVGDSNDNINALPSNVINKNSTTLNYFDSAIDSNTHTTLTISGYVLKNGLIVTSNSSGNEIIVVDRDSFVEVPSSTVINGLTFSSSYGYISRSNVTLSYNSFIELQIYEVLLQGETLYFVFINKIVTEPIYTPLTNILVIEAESYHLIELSEIGVLQVKIGENINTVIGMDNGNMQGNIDQLSLTSLNTNVVTISNKRRIQTGFVLQDTYVTINADYQTGKNSKISFHFDILVQSSVAIAPIATSVNVTSGSSVNIDELYTITRDGEAITINDIPNASVVYYMQSSQSAPLQSNILTAADLYEYAGQVVPVVVKVYINQGESTEQVVDVMIALNIEENMYQLNVKEDIYSLYSGQSIDLTKVHLKLQDSNGYLLTSNPTIQSLEKPDSSYPYVIENETIIRALNVFEDVRAVVNVIINYNTSLYSCRLDLYILKSYYTVDEYIINSLYVEEVIGVNDILESIDIYNPSGKKYTTTELNSRFNFSFESGENFHYNYNAYNASGTYNLTQKMYIKDSVSNHTMHTITITIRELKADRSLSYGDGYDSNTTIMVNTPTYDVIELFNNGYLSYTTVSGHSAINLDWFNVEVINNVENIEYENGTLINRNTKENILTHDNVRIELMDKNTRQKVSLYITLKKAS